MPARQPHRSVRWAALSGGLLSVLGATACPKSRECGEVAYPRDAGFQVKAPPGAIQSIRVIDGCGAVRTRCVPQPFGEFKAGCDDYQIVPTQGGVCEVEIVTQVGRSRFRTTMVDERDLPCNNDLSIYVVEGMPSTFTLPPLPDGGAADGMTETSWK